MGIAKSDLGFYRILVDSIGFYHVLSIGIYCILSNLSNMYIYIYIYIYIYPLSIC